MAGASRPGEAPLKENLAAGILRLTQWNTGHCTAGSDVRWRDVAGGGGDDGIAYRPGSMRGFAFERLSGFDAVPVEDASWRKHRPRVNRSAPLPIYGADLYGEQLKLAKTNLAAAGLADVVTLKQANVLEMPPPASAGVLVTNPPYGVRIGEQQDLAAFYPRLGDALKAKYAGWKAWVFTADMRLPKLIGLKPSRRIPLYNGALECRLYGFEIVAGSMRKKGEGCNGVKRRVRVT